MIKVKKEGVLLKKTASLFENIAVLNPGVFQEGNNVHLFYRAIGSNYKSVIGYCKLKGPLKVNVRSKVPVIFNEFEYESVGMEDPRLVKIDGLYYLTYAAYDGINALGAIAISSDLIIWKKLGIIVPAITYYQFSLLTLSIEMQERYSRHNNYHGPYLLGQKPVLMWNKNLILFPRRINGKLFLLHRFKPDIQIVSVSNISELTELFWMNYLSKLKSHILLAPKFGHESNYIGGGCVPIETKYGWILIYHGVSGSVNGNIYCACASLLDLNNPSRELARLPYPLFKPETDWELNGLVNNVCFPTATAIFDDRLYIYYGAADNCIAVASLDLSQLLHELLINPISYEFKY